VNRTEGSNSLHRTLIIIRGLPGTGKTTAANYLKNKYSYYIVDPDTIEILEYIKYLNNIHNLIDFIKYHNIKTLKFRINISNASELISNSKKVIWCQMFSSLDGLEYSIRKIRKNTSINIATKIINIRCPKSELEIRNSSKKWLTPDKLDILTNKMQYNFTQILDNGIKIIDIYNESSLDEFYRKLDCCILDII
jgi:tRNA uridine 5-carbamoylmethylation protein Kti12